MCLKKHQCNFVSMDEVWLKTKKEDELNQKEKT